MELENNYEIPRTVNFIRSRNYTKVVLQVLPPLCPSLMQLLVFLFLYVLSLTVLSLSFGFARIVLDFLILYLRQFPDELLKDSASVCKALRRELGRSVRVYVMADTAYNSCCIDEVGASYVGAECVVHYGHACMSPLESLLQILFVFSLISLI
jgi:diphthamide synthase subunit DPH2